MPPAQGEYGIQPCDIAPRQRPHLLTALRAEWPVWSDLPTLHSEPQGKAAPADQLKRRHLLTRQHKSQCLLRQYGQAAISTQSTPPIAVAFPWHCYPKRNGTTNAPVQSSDARIDFETGSCHCQSAFALASFAWPIVSKPKSNPARPNFVSLEQWTCTIWIRRAESRLVGVCPKDDDAT